MNFTPINRVILQKKGLYPTNNGFYSTKESLYPTKIGFYITKKCYSMSNVKKKAK